LKPEISRTRESQSESLQLRIHGPPSLPTLVYLPGLHGDWTLIGGFRRALRDRVHFVEMTYPRTLSWSLEEYAAAVEIALAERGITQGWLLGESFGSQVLWPMVARRRFASQGVILAGGFVCHPNRWGVRLAERLCGSAPLHLITRVLFGYARLARFRHRHNPEVVCAIDEFIARRTELDRQAAQHRLHLILHSDPSDVARNCSVPVYALSGVMDPVVPWIPVRGWLRRHCPRLREYRVIYRGEHAVLNSAAQAAAEQILRWIGECPPRP
jgi:pimeloyl-ACP methyl ester carboxylesterase